MTKLTTSKKGMLYYLFPEPKYDAAMKGIQVTVFTGNNAKVVATATFCKNTSMEAPTWQILRRVFPVLHNTLVHTVYCGTSQNVGSKSIKRNSNTNKLASTNSRQLQRRFHPQYTQHNSWYDIKNSALRMPVSTTWLYVTVSIYGVNKIRFKRILRNCIHMWPELVKCSVMVVASWSALGCNKFCDPSMSPGKAGHFQAIPARLENIHTLPINLIFNNKCISKLWVAAWASAKTWLQVSLLQCKGPTISAPRIS